MENDGTLELLQSHERDAAISYLNEQLGGTVIGAIVSPLIGEHGDIYLALSNRPPKLDFTRGYGAGATESNRWLEKAIAEYVDGHKTSICIIEDFCTEPADALSGEMQRFLLRYCNGHALWLLGDRKLNIAETSEAIAWCAVGRPTLVAFATAEESFLGDINRRTVSVEQLKSQLLHIERIATDVCDQEGYLVLDRSGR